MFKIDTYLGIKRSNLPINCYSMKKAFALNNRNFFIVRRSGASDLARTVFENTETTTNLLKLTEQPKGTLIYIK